MGALVYQWYEKSFSGGDTNLTVDLSENAEAREGQFPFENQFEFTFLFGASRFFRTVPPLSLRKLAAIREIQVSAWTKRQLLPNELVIWQQSIIDAGYFEAYNYLLFQSARRDEFNQWIKEHQADYQAWTDWLAKNKFTVRKPDFQRLYIMRSAPEPTITGPVS
jgi:hypothetical protein